MESITGNMIARYKRAATRAAIAMTRGDEPGYRKHIEQAKFWEKILRDAGEDVEAIR